MHIKRALPQVRHLYGLPKNHGPKTLPPANGPESVLPGGLALLQGTWESLMVTYGPEIQNLWKPLAAQWHTTSELLLLSGDLPSIQVHYSKGLGLSQTILI